MTSTARSERFRIRLSSESSEYAENLEALVGTKWCLYQVTPLHKLHYTEARLKQYALRLREALPQQENTDVRWESSFMAFPELRPAEDSPVPLKITVEALIGADAKQTYYTGIMLSWKKVPIPSQQDDHVSLPVLLCKGGRKITESVHNMLCNFFDCDIIDVTFEKDDLLYMLGLTTHFHDQESDDVHLSFCYPGLGYKHSLDYTVQLGVLKEMWKSSQETDGEYITLDNVDHLRNQCFHLFEETYGVHIRMLSLNSVKFKDFLISSKGMIKFSRELAENLLEFVYNKVTAP